MRNTDKIYDMLYEAFFDFIKGDEIILLEKDVTVKKRTIDNKGVVVFKDEQIGVTTISVKILDFIEIYRNILADDSIQPEDLLLAMKVHKFYDDQFREIDKGYVNYITQWIDKGITLKGE